MLFNHIFLPPDFRKFITAEFPIRNVHKAISKEAMASYVLIRDGFFINLNGIFSGLLQFLKKSVLFPVPEIQEHHDRERRY